MEKLAIVLLNWNGIEWLKKFLPTLVKNSDGYTIYIIDNQSTDNSMLWIKKNYPFIKIIPLDKNYGFAGGYNIGLKQIKATYFLLLNSDVEVTPNWIAPLIKKAESDKLIKIIQPKIKSYKEKNKFEYAGAAGGFIDFIGIPFCRGRIFNKTEIDTGQYDKSTEIFWASGAAFFIESAIFFELKGFDATFFAHMEEIDLCWRAKNKNYKIVYEPTSVVYHYGGGTLNKQNAFKTYLNVRNSLIILTKNYPSPTLFLALFLRMFTDGLFAFKFLFEFKISHSYAILKAHLYFYFHFITLYKSREKNMIKQLPPHIIKNSIILHHFIFKKEFNQIYTSIKK